MEGEAHARALEEAGGAGQTLGIDTEADVARAAKVNAAKVWRGFQNGPIFARGAIFIGHRARLVRACMVRGQRA